MTVGNVPTCPPFSLLDLKHFRDGALVFVGICRVWIAMISVMPKYSKNIRTRSPLVQVTVSGFNAKDTGISFAAKGGLICPIKDFFCVLLDLP